MEANKSAIRILGNGAHGKLNGSQGGHTPPEISLTSLLVTTCMPFTSLISSSVKTRILVVDIDFILLPIVLFNKL